MTFDPAVLRAARGYASGLIILVALVLGSALATSALAAEMSCRPGASCGGPLEPVTWFKGICPRLIADPQRNPCAAAVGRTETTIRPGEVERGSGFIFLHPREFMTSTHGVKSDLRIRIRFRLATGDLNAFGTVVRRGAYYGRASGGHIQNVAGDWAILVLDGPIPGVRPLQQFVGDSSTAQKLGNRFSLIGFDAHEDTARVCAACSIAKLNDFGMIEHNCGASKGTSGGPLLTTNPYGGCEVVGMQVIQDPRARDGEVFDGKKPNMAVDAKSFIDDALKVRDLLSQGLGIAQIRKTMNP